MGKLISFLALIGILIGAMPSLAEERPAQELQRAIYAEEVLGDIAGAQKLYEGIVERADKDRQTVAEALLHLGQCQLKLGQKDLSVKTFQRLAQGYSDVPGIRGSLDKLLPGSTTADLILKPIPWVDGEVLEYEIYGAGETPVAYENHLKSQSTSPDGKPAWLTEVMLLDVAAKGGQYIQSWVDGRSAKLIASEIKGSGWRGATFQFDENGKGTGKNLETGTGFTGQRDRDAYDDNLLVDLLRRLPLELGYKKKIKFFNWQNLAQTELTLAVVSDAEKIVVPAGEFYTYHVNISSPFGDGVQTADFWVAKSDQAPVVQIKRSNVVIQLRNASSKSGRESTLYRNVGRGFELTLPPRWAIFDASLGDKGEMKMMLSPFNVDKVSADITSKFEGNIDWKTTSIRIVTQWNIDWAKGYFKYYKVREDSMTEFTIGGLPAIKYISDYKWGNFDMVEYRVIAINNPVVYQATFRVMKADFESMRPEFDALINSVKVIDKDKLR